MGAKVDVPRNKVAAAKAALAEGIGFGKAAEGNHPDRPGTTRLDYEDLPLSLERAFAEGCRMLGLYPIFYEVRGNLPRKP